LPPLEGQARFGRRRWDIHRFDVSAASRIAFDGGCIHYCNVISYRVAAKIAVCMLLVFLSLGLGTSAGAGSDGAASVSIAQIWTAAPGCHGSPTQHTCGSDIPDCGISCPVQGVLAPATEALLAVQVVASVEYPRLSKAWPGRDVAPSPYPPRADTIG
jgi:hypothetical protein